MDAFTNANARAGEHLSVFLAAVDSALLTGAFMLDRTADGAEDFRDAYQLAQHIANARTRALKTTIEDI